MRNTNVKYLKTIDYEYQTISRQSFGRAERSGDEDAGGLYIPDTAKEKPSQGVVIAVGSGKKDEPMEVKCGDIVLFGKYAGNEVQLEDKKYLIMKQSDIMAIIG